MPVLLDLEAPERHWFVKLMASNGWLIAAETVEAETFQGALHLVAAKLTPEQTELVASLDVQMIRR